MVWCMYVAGVMFMHVLVNHVCMKLKRLFLNCAYCDVVHVCVASVV